MVGNLNISGGLIQNLTVVTTSPYNATTSQSVLGVDTSSIAITINLPASPTRGQILYVKDITGSAATRNITVAGNGHNIEGSATYTIASNYGGAGFIYGSTQWAGLPATNVTFPLSLANGGTGASLAASNGGIFYSNASTGAILSGTATARQMLQSGSSTTPAWSTATYPATTTANQILYSSAANTVSEITTSANGVLITNNSSVPSLLANGTAGYVLTAQSGAPPAWAATATAFTWSVITANQTAVVNNGYICNKGSTLVLTLPASAAIGDIIRVTGINTATGWQIAQSANQQIFFGTTQTTLGATGTLTSSAIRDSIEIVCVVAGASTVWNVISSIGNITVV